MLQVAAPHFLRAGVEIDILSVGPAGTGPYAEHLKKAGYNVHHIPYRRDLRSYLKIARFMRMGNYDVIHLHTEGSNLWFGLAALHSRSPRVIRTIHSAFAFTGWLRVKRKVHRRIVHWLGLKHVSISPAVTETEWRHFRNPTTLVNNWFDDGRFAPPSEMQRAQ